MAWKSTTHKYGQPGIFHTPSYQSSGHPWTTGSVINTNTMQRVRFPRVTKSFTVLNTGSDANDHILVTFAPNGGRTDWAADCLAGARVVAATDDVFAGNHYVAIAGQTGSYTFNVKCKEVFISNVSAVLGHGNQQGYILTAELTSITTGSMYVLTGSGISSTDGTVAM